MNVILQCFVGIAAKCELQKQKLFFCFKNGKKTKMKWFRRIFFCVFFLLGMFVDRNRGSGRVPRQVIQQDGLIVKEWWLGALYRLLPSIFYTENSVPTPLMFLPYLQTISSKIFQGFFGLPTIVFDDRGPYSFNKLAIFLFGINIFQLIGIALLVFVASIALVS